MNDTNATRAPAGGLNPARHRGRCDALPIGSGPEHSSCPAEDALAIARELSPLEQGALIILRAGALRRADSAFFRNYERTRKVGVSIARKLVHLGLATFSAGGNGISISLTATGHELGGALATRI